MPSRSSTQTFIRKTLKISFAPLVEPGHRTQHFFIGVIVLFTAQAKGRFGKQIGVDGIAIIVVKAEIF
jgi:hypothetical protein